jgi:hypothetical protein
VPEMNIIQDIPIVLDNVSVSDEYDGDFQTRRFVTHTLNFTIKTNIYGPVSTQGVIKDVTANIGTKSINEIQLTYNGYVGSTGQIFESWEDNF